MPSWMKWWVLLLVMILALAYYGSTQPHDVPTRNLQVQTEP